MAMKGASLNARRYADEFKIEAVKQVTERGSPVPGAARRLGVTSYSLYQCRKQFGMGER